MNIKRFSLSAIMIAFFAASCATTDPYGDPVDPPANEQSSDSNKPGPTSAKKGPTSATRGGPTSATRHRHGSGPTSATKKSSSRTSSSKSTKTAKATVPSKGSSTGKGGSWVGSWGVDSVRLDGKTEPTLGAVWSLSKNSWKLSTFVCSAGGPLYSKGSNLTLKVANTNCPANTVSAVGRSMHGNANVRGSNMTLSLNHKLKGKNHSLVSKCKRK